MNKPKLELYYFPSCPFCQIVLRSISHLGLKGKLTNIHVDSQAREKLFQDTKRYTVPCLYIDNNPMHESYDIIAWLEKNEGTLDKAQ